MACNFGWDWGPRLVTAGIWRAVHIERWRVARLAAVRVHAGVRTAAARPGERGDLVVDVELAHGPDGTDRGLRLEVAVRDPDGALVARRTTGLAPDATAATVTTPVDDIRRWCPRGSGEPARYDVVVTLAEGDHELDGVTRRVGFRSVTLDTSSDHDGAAFAFVVNGRRTWIRGFNWIPDDCFPSRVTPARLAGRLDQAAAANANLLRVWGGGVYESDDFYDECDERGMLVWQDFPFACAAYPEELARGRGARRGDRQRRASAVAPEPARVERQQREPDGVRRLGVARAARWAIVGRGVLPHAPARHRG